MREQGFHVLIPAALGFILLALLVLLARRVFQRRKGEGVGLGWAELPKESGAFRPLFSPEESREF